MHQTDQLIGSVVIFKDITERKQNEKEIKRINLQSDIALGLTKSGYWYVDYSDPDYYYQSERAAEILGEPWKEDGRYHLQDEWFSRLVEANPETAELTSERYQGAIDGKYETYDSIYAYKRPIDGEIVWIHAAGDCVRDDNGELQIMYGVYQDITERIKAEQEITRVNFQSDMALELTTSGYWLIDYSDPEYYTPSARAAEIFGETPGEDGRLHLTDEWYTRLHEADPEGAERTAAHYQDAVEGRVDRYDTTYAYKRPVDGRVAWIRAIGHCVRDGNGKIQFMYGVSQDVTDSVLAQHELQEKLEELARFQRLAVGRELKMIDLKKEVNEFLAEIGQDPRYRIVTDPDYSPPERNT
jgi:PAS domain-containing protein